MVWKIDDPQGNEAAKIRHLIVPYTRGAGLDLGCGPWKAWPHFMGMDNLDEYQGVTDPITGRHWKPDIWGDCTDLSMFSDNALDFVFSSHLLEHLDDTAAILREWWRVIKPGGHLCLYLPHKDFYPNMGQEGANPDHLHDFAPADIVEIMKGIGGWDLVENQERNQKTEYSFLQVYQKGQGHRHKFSHLATESIEAPRCLVIRYGGIGDMIQASSVLPGLKKQGYHVTINTVPMGETLLRSDPNVDAMIVQDKDQVPNVELNDYWVALSEEYDRVINLCESVEGTLLALPGRRTHAMPASARRMLFNHNYLEIHHALAAVPFKPAARFHPTSIEKHKAAKFRHELGNVPVIVWSLSGSSVHKVYPWTDQVISYLLRHTPAKIITVGDKTEQVLEACIGQQLAKEFMGILFTESHEMKLSTVLGRLKTHFGANRLICKAGSWSIRETLSFLPYANLVIGPETGVLNAAGLLDVPKLVFLSHSSQENLTKHWKNTVALEPGPEIACYPCHRMHYGHEFCPRSEETGTAICSSSISAKRVMDSVMNILLEKVRGSAAE